jgi:hypothetical protein
LKDGSEVFTVAEAKALIKGIYYMLEAAYNSKYVGISPVLGYSSGTLDTTLAIIDRAAEDLIERTATNGMVDRGLIIDIINWFEYADDGVALQPVTFISQTEWSNCLADIRACLMPWTKQSRKQRAQSVRHRQHRKQRVVWN